MVFELAHSPVGGPVPDRWLLMTHGIFGSGGNLRTLARHITERRPDYGALLVDLREHGRSRGAPPPHTIAAAAADVVALVERWAADGRTVAALFGHSLGGKVMLTARAALAGSIAQTWVIDSPLTVRAAAVQRSTEVTGVLEMLEALPSRWPSRDAFAAAIEAEGRTAALAQWLAMNLERTDAGEFVFGLDLSAMRALLADYYQLDGWPLVEDARGGDVHVVVATRGTGFDDADRARLAALSAARPHVQVHDIDTGHWVHAEEPAELAQLVAAHLPGR